MNENKYDCMKCGACCAYWPNIPVRETEVKDIDERLKLYLKPSSLEPRGLSMKFVEGSTRCVALEGQLGVSVKCSIYDIRPPVCRRFEPGSDLCKKARREVLNIVD